MPRDKGGSGRTGSKQKAAKAKREAAAAAQAAAQLIRPAPPASPRPKRPRTASTEEQPATPADAAAQAAAQVTEQLANKTKKMVRFADDLPAYREGRKALPGSNGWTWGRRWQWPYGASFTPSGSEDFSPDELGPDHVAFRADKLALQQHMTAVRFADYVAAGCIGPEPREWPDSADPWTVERTHRRWCPLEHEHPTWRNAWVPEAHPHPDTGKPWCKLCIPADPDIAAVWYAQSLYKSL
jgi:hypothetical protein